MSLRLIGGVFGGRILKSPKGSQTRPTMGVVRGAIFNVCQERIHGARVLDLFAGSGAIGFEALSRGAAFTTFVEQNKAAAACIRENGVLLGVIPKIQIVPTAVLSALPRLLGPYDLIYIDPPYDLDISRVMKGLITHNLLSPTTLIFLEERYEPKKTAPTFSSLSLIDTRRYGIAYLHQYVFSS